MDEEVEMIFTETKGQQLNKYVYCIVGNNCGKCYACKLKKRLSS